MKIITILLLIVVAATATTATFTHLVRKAKHLQQLHSVSDSNTRIIDGKPAIITAPYIVSLSLSALIYSHNCAGAILDKEWVLTAAHCVNEIKEHAGDIIGLPVVAGLHNRSNMENAQAPKIDFAYVHKEFNGHVQSDDIALLHVAKPFKFNEHVQPVALPYPEESYAGVETTTYGWGLTENDSDAYVDALQTTKGKVTNAAECKNLLAADAPIHENQICANVISGYGDGGSPLVFEQSNSVRELVGITSWAYLPFGYDKRPTVFTNVAKYVQWIRKVQSAYYTLH